MTKLFKKIKKAIEEQVFCWCTRICSKNGYMCVPYDRRSKLIVDKLGLRKMSMVMNVSPEHDWDRDFSSNEEFAANEIFIKRMKYKLASDITSKLMPMVEEKRDGFERPYLSLDIFVNKEENHDKHFEEDNELSFIRP